MTRVLLLFFGLCCAWTSTSPVAGQESELQSARVHLLRGRYEEARDALERLEKSFQEDESLDGEVVEFVILASHLHQSLGEWSEAISILETDRLARVKSPKLFARKAELAFLTGQYGAAEKLAQSALDLEKNQPLATLVLGDVFTETGRLKDAEEKYRDLVRYYNQTQPTDAETLLIVARGAAQYARWNGSTQIFEFIVNTLCPDAIADDKNYWPAYYFSGLMFLEKYNEPDAIAEFQSALAINFQSAETLTAIARSRLIKFDYEAAEQSAKQALEINPRYPPALTILADVALWRGNPDDALDALRQALDVNPCDQFLLAREAFCDMLKTGWPTVEELESLCSHLEVIDDYKVENIKVYQQIFIDLARRNSHPGDALAELGRLFVSHRRYPQAEVCFVWANRLFPKLPAPKADLAELYLRVGRLDEGQALLDEAFKADPYHVRISNLRKVLDQLNQYRTITTEHFIIRVDGERDGIYGEALADYLEDIYPELTQAFGFEPPERTQVDVFHEGSGESAQAWFSARMTGLPWLHTIGASTGNVISMVSPTATAKPYNWAHVARHEFVHVLTLQQTDFAIPHWLTEALAVKYESSVMPWQWQELLSRRFSAGKLFELTTLNDGFQRAKSPEDWQMAYCQSRLYLEFLEQNFGPQVALDLIKSYRLNLTTQDAVRKACGIEVIELEASFETFVRSKIDKWGQSTFAAGTVAEWEQRHEQFPEDLDVQIFLARVLWESGEQKRATAIIRDVLAFNDRHETANLFLADTEIKEKQLDAARDRLLKLWNPQSPSLPVLLRLTAYHILNDDRRQAAEMCRIGLGRWPENVPLMKMCLENTGDKQQKEKILESLVAYENNTSSYSRQLCQLAWDKMDYPAVVRHGKNVLHIDVLDASIYPMLGESYRKQNEPTKAAKAFATAWELDGENFTFGIKAAECFRDAGAKQHALEMIDAVLKDHPDDDNAIAFRQALDKKDTR
ncbi:MAG: tetratricopeptide repeat protein [Planctomycetota bacterium]|nr:tetratricopeptide repeat protein [Planctomycetota bacterium]